MRIVIVIRVIVKMVILVRVVIIQSLTTVAQFGQALVLSTARGRLNLLDKVFQLGALLGKECDSFGFRSAKTMGR